MQKEVIPMKKQDILSLVKLLLVPCLLILLGLILVVNPDAASAMISAVLGYGLIACGVVCGIIAVFSSRGKIGKGVFAVLLAAAGGWLVRNPLILAAWAGRFLGVLILLNSLPDLIQAYKQGRGILFQLISALIGVVLILLPMTTSRLVFTLCGVVVLIIGALMFFDRIRGRRWLKAGEDPDIIDAL